jgi:WD40 repeat protein
MGFPADIIIWDFSNQALLHRLSLHKGAVQSLAFSPDSLFLASVGGRDDNALVLWSIPPPLADATAAVASAICGTSLVGSTFQSVAFFHSSPRHLITTGAGGQGGSAGAVKMWYADLENRKLRATDVNLGTIKRVGTCVATGADDKVAFVGTTTGDLLQVDTQRALFRGISDAIFPGGVTAVEMLIQTASGTDLLVGSGTGLIVRIRTGSGEVASVGLKVVKKAQVLGAVRSIAKFKDNTHAFILTDKGNTYILDVESMTCELKNTSHCGSAGSSGVHSVAFPFGLSDVFMTTSAEEIRVWNAKNKTEILRISVPGVDCNVAVFSRDGRLIVSGWADGKIRGFLPQSGKLCFVLNDAHRGGVTALLVAPSAGGTAASGGGAGGEYMVISGGAEGEVRVWRISTVGHGSQSLLANLKEHRGRVFAVKVKSDLSKCVSASADGSCIVWDLKTFTRSLCLFESTMFKAVVYHPDESQLITAGSDRKITFWDVFDGQAIRTLEGSETSEVNSLAISQDGRVFVSTGGDGLVKVWLYDEGVCKHVGVGHSNAVNMVKISPDGSKIVSVGEDGGIFIWDFPQDI